MLLSIIMDKNRREGAPTHEPARQSTLAQIVREAEELLKGYEENELLGRTYKKASVPIAKSAVLGDRLEPNSTIDVFRPTGESARAATCNYEVTIKPPEGPSLVHFGIKADEAGLSGLYNDDPQVVSFDDFGQLDETNAQLILEDLHRAVQF